MYLDLACRHLCFPPEKCINRRNESIFFIIKILGPLSIVFPLPINFWLFEPLRLFPSDSEEIVLLIQEKDKFSRHHWQDFPSRSMATLGNKRKLAAVSRETPEGSRSSRGQNVLDPELTQDYISQVSEEIKGRVTKKLSKEFSITESRILGALSKLDEFLLNPQVRTCSVAVPETSRNSNSENRETTGDRSLDDPCPEVGYFSHHSGQLNSPDTENYRHKDNCWLLTAESCWLRPLLENSSQIKKRICFEFWGKNRHQWPPSIFLDYQD